MESLTKDEADGGHVRDIRGPKSKEKAFKREKNKQRREGKEKREIFW